MAANKFASMLHRNTNRLTLVLVYVLLEWILIAAILLNSLFSYLIVKYTDYFGLKRPCVLCSRIDHGEDKRVRKDMICEEHALEISELGFCQTHQKLGECSQMCQNCSASSFCKIDEDSRCSCCDERLKEKCVLPVLVENRDFDHEKQSVEQEKVEAVEEEDMQQLVSVELVMSGDAEDVSESLVADTDQDYSRALDTVSGGDYSLTAGAPLAADTYEEAQTHVNNVGDHDSEYSSERSEIITRSEDPGEVQAISRNGVEEKSDFEQQKVDLSALDDSSYQYSLTIEKLTLALNEVRTELEQERSDAAEASSQTMAMITKLQKENAALKLEATQYKRMTDEQIASDHEAAFSLDESKFNAKLEIEEQQSELNEASTIEKLTMTLNKAYAELEQERNDYEEASSQTMAMITKLQEEKSALQLEASQYQRMAEEQIAFDEEAVLLLDEMVRRREKENHELEKELELYKRRFGEQEKTRRSEEDHLHHNQKNLALALAMASESVSVCCSSFSDQDSDRVSTEDEEDQHQQHHAHYDDYQPQAFEDSEYERLSILERLNELEQKLVEDNDNIVEEDCAKCGNEEEFLRRCIKTVKKGDEGMSLVKEILQHLRALRRMEFSFS